MDYFNTIAGQNRVDSLVLSLERIALAIEKNNELLEQIVRMNDSDKRVSAEYAASANPISSKTYMALSELTG